MNLPTAIDEFVGMLTLGSEALRRLAKGEADHAAQTAIDASIDEVQSVAQRLSVIANDLRGGTRVAD